MKILNLGAARIPFSVLLLFLLLTSCNQKQETTEPVASNSEFESPSFQLGIVVKDLDESVAFYKNVLGMVDSRTFAIDETFGKNSGLSDSVAFKVTALKLEDQPTAPEWKLIQFDSVHLKGFPKRIQDDVGVQYTTLLVKSIAPFLQRFKEHGVNTLGATPMKLPNGKNFVLIQDPNGVFIELIGGD
jgi:catechol 2,3-dioxygenase-like lactoylglutathione lyase family enzyme